MFLKLYHSVKITAGAKRAIIYDTASGFLRIIPKGLFNLIANERTDYTSLRKEMAPEDLSILNDYLNFITTHKLGFTVKDKKELRDFRSNTSFKENPTLIEYIIIDISDPALLNKQLTDQISDLQIKFLEIRIVKEINTADIKQIISKLALFDHSSLHEISIVAKYSSELVDSIKEGNIHTNKLIRFTLYSSDLENEETFGPVILSMIRQDIAIPTSCGCINAKNFNLNYHFSLESKAHNSCLYKKISIDKDGYIRNCPSMPENFGNIKNTLLKTVANTPDLKKYWNLTKDKIEICKDCEFRDICTDCRAYTERTHTDRDGLDISKPLKCGYNPNTGEWEAWSTNPLKQNAIQYYKMQKFTKDII